MSNEASNPADAWKSKTGGGDYAKVAYLNLADGETVDVRILDIVPKEVYITRIPVNGKRYPVSLQKSDNEVVKNAGHKIQKVNAANVLDRRDGVVKLWEFSEEKKGDIHGIIERWKKMPTEFDISITRKGKKLQTRYSLTISPNQEPLTDEEKALKKVDLDEYYKHNPERLASLLAGKVPERKTEENDTTSQKQEVGVAASSDDEEEVNPLEESDDVV